MIALTTTKPNCHLAWRWIRESWAPGQTLFTLVRPRAPHYDWMTPVTPNVKMSHNSISSPPLCPDSRSGISQRSANPVFSFSLWTLTTENDPPSYYMRMMLMSASHILMTQHINWVLTEVPLSLHLHQRFLLFFFCPAKFHRGPCQSESAAREGVSPSFSH